MPSVSAPSGRPRNTTAVSAATAAETASACSAGSSPPVSRKPGENDIWRCSPAASLMLSRALSTRVALTWELPAPWNFGVRANSPMTGQGHPGWLGQGAECASSFFSRTADSAARPPGQGVMPGRSQPPEPASGRGRAVEQREQARDGLVEHRFFEYGRLDGIDQARRAGAARGRHLQVEPGGDRGDRVVDRAPVRHHEAVEAPFLAQHPGEQPTVLGGVDAVDLVVGGHHRPRGGGGDDVLEAGQVDLPSVRSSTSALIRMRPVSWLLAAKCFTEAPTPLLCMPRTRAAAS